MNVLFLLQASAAFSLKPLVILIVSIVFIIVLIVRFRIHAFFALIGAALLVAFLSASSLPAMLDNIKLVSLKFGQTAGGIGLVIAFAAIIGMSLTESGAADAIVRRFISMFGEKRAAWALLVSGFILSIPVFLDTVFFLLIPLARVLGMRTRKDYILYILALGGGAAITHSMVPPTPGPLLVGDILGLDLGLLIVTGVLAGLLPAVAVYFFARRMNRTMPLRVRETKGVAEMPFGPERLPSFRIAILPVILPVLLISVYSFVDMSEKAHLKAQVVTQFQTSGEQINAEVLAARIKEVQSSPGNYSLLHRITGVLGEKVIALAIGALIAVSLLMRQRRISWKNLEEKCGQPLELAGVIILITSAGGAFGAMISNAGIGEVISKAAENFNVSYILLAWFITAIIRVAQGSGTVSMITGAGLMSAVLTSLHTRGEILPYHPLYIFLAIGFGSIACSWMNDSAFWIFGKLSGLTEKETLKSYTVMVTVISVVGLIETMVLSQFLPLL